jgi:putative (di)nucleoside polyphosphate hydrolase
MSSSPEIDYRSCVGLMVLNKSSEIFTAQRLDFKSTAWQMPQGGIDVGEEPLEAAFRELEEETSITKDSVKILAVSKSWIKYDLPEDLIPMLWNGKYRGQRQKWFLLKYFGEDSQIDLNTSEPEFSCWRWSDKTQLIKSVVVFKKEVYETVLEEFSSYL